MGGGDEDGRRTTASTGACQRLDVLDNVDEALGQPTEATMAGVETVRQGGSFELTIRKRG